MTLRVRRARATAVIFVLSLTQLRCEPPIEAGAEHLQRGDRAIAESRYEDAVIAYNYARELAPTDPRVQRRLMQARCYLVAEQPSRVTPDLMDGQRYEAEFLIEHDPSQRAVYLTALGNVLSRMGEADAARARFDEALRAEPDSALAHGAFGLHLKQQADGAPRAKIEFELALKTKPDHLPALVGLAELLVAEGNADAAAAPLEKALSLRDAVEGRILLGKIRLRQEKSAAAIEEFRRASRLDPRNPDSLVALGDALLAAGEPEEAERALRAALSIRQDAPTTVAFGYALLQQNKSQQALDVFTRVLAREGDVATALFGAGTACEQLTETDQAISYYERLARLAGPSGASADSTHESMVQRANQRLEALGG